MRNFVPSKEDVRVLVQVPAARHSTKHLTNTAAKRTRYHNFTVRHSRPYEIPHCVVLSLKDKSAGIGDLGIPLESHSGPAMRLDEHVQ